MRAGLGGERACSLHENAHARFRAETGESAREAPDLMLRGGELHRQVQRKHRFFFGRASRTFSNFNRLDHIPRARSGNLGQLRRDGSAGRDDFAADGVGFREWTGEHRHPA